jgi:ankyrin repeat protein
MMKNRWLISLILIVSLLGMSYCGSKKDKKSESVSTAPNDLSKVTAAPLISIHEAALNGRLNDVTALLKSGIRPDTLDQEGRTPLSYAAYNGNTEIMGLLIRNGADVNKADKFGRTALMMASSGPYPMAVKMLLDQKADPNLVDTEEHFTALMYAAAEGQLECVRILLLYKADPVMKDKDGDDALSFARNNGHKAIVTLLESLNK